MSYENDVYVYVNEHILYQCRQENFIMISLFLGVLTPDVLHRGFPHRYLRIFSRLGRVYVLVRWSELEMLDQNA